MTADPSAPDLTRGVQVVLRTVHIVTMAFALEGLASPGPQLGSGFTLACVSGVLLLAATMAWGCLDLSQGAGWAVFLKVGLLGVAWVVPGHRLVLYVAAMVVASIASHMPRTWRHFSFGRPLA